MVSSCSKDILLLSLWMNKRNKPLNKNIKTKQHLAVAAKMMCFVLSLLKWFPSWEAGARPPSRDKTDGGFQDGGVFWLASLLVLWNPVPQGSAALDSALNVFVCKHLSAYRILSHHLVREQEQTRYLLIKGDYANRISEDIRSDLPSARPAVPECIAGLSP